MSEALSIEATGSSDSRRIVNGKGELMEMCERYTGGMWAVHNKETGRQLCPPSHSTPRKAMRWFEASQPARREP